MLYGDFFVLFLASSTFSPCEQTHTTHARTVYLQEKLLAAAGFFSLRRVRAFDVSVWETKFPHFTVLTCVLCVSVCVSVSVHL